MSGAALAVSSYTDDVVAEHRDKGAAKVVSLGDIRLYECPVSFLTDDTRELMRLCFFIEETGTLLYEGGWGGQPHWLIEAYEVCRIEALRLQKEKSDGGR